MAETKLGTPRRKVVRCFALALALATALALAGCGSDHVGDSWQCPLAEGGSCASVAAADPAVPVAGSGKVLGEPLWKPRSSSLDAPEVSVCSKGCGDGSGPFGWLGRLFGSGQDLDAGPDTADAAPGIVASTFAPANGNDGLAELTSSTLPAGPDSVREGMAADDLRTGEVVARIWIAPFVDGNGVYREAGHVRVVLEPAGWRDG